MDLNSTRHDIVRVLTTHTHLSRFFVLGPRAPVSYKRGRPSACNETVLNSSSTKPVPASRPSASAVAHRAFI